MKYILSLLVCCFLYTGTFAQKIAYTQPDNNDTRNMNFDVIGKIGGNYLIYKNVRNAHAISVYDDRMDVIDKVDMKFLGDKTLNVDFIAYPDFAWMIYQYQQRNTIYSSAVKIDRDGKLLSDPVVLDTSVVSFFADKKIYTTISSEDKKQIMVFKIQKKNDRFKFTTLLFDDALNLKHRSVIETDYQDKKFVFSDFLLSNSGNLVFTAGNRSGSRDYIEQLELITKPPFSDTFETTALNLNDRYIDEVKLKVDNRNSHYIVNSFYYLKKRGNTEGLYTAVINQDDNRTVSTVFAKMADDLRANLRAKGSSKTALNDFFIRDVILKNDGGFLLMAEDFYTESRYSPWNRWDYMYGSSPFYSPYYYSYSPYYSPYYFGNRYYNSYNDTRFYYNNILVLSLDSTGSYEWTRVVNKNQYDDRSDNELSYSLMITGGKLHFLFNESTRRTQMLNERTIDGDGQITRNPPMHNLDRGYTFMPRFARQVSASEIIVPCNYRNYIAFAKIQF